MVAVAEALWGMLFADVAGIVSRSLESFEKMMSVIVRVPGLFALMVSERKTETMCCCRKGRRSAVHDQRRRPDVPANGLVRLP